MANNIYAPFTYSDIGPRPYSPGNAVEVAERDMQARQAQEYALQQMMMQNQNQQMQNQLFQQTMPDKVNVSHLEGNQAQYNNRPAFLEAMSQGQMGDAYSKFAKGTTDMATMGTGIDATNAANTTNALTQTVQQLRAQAAFSPMMAQANYQTFRAKLPPQVQQFMPTMYDPESVENAVKVFTDTPQHRGQMEVEKLKSDTALKVGQGNNAATVEAAKYRAGARIKDLFDQFQSAKTPEQMLFVGQMILNSDEADERTKAMVRKGTETAARIIAQKNSKGSIDFNNPTGGTGGIENDYWQRLLGGPNAPGPTQGNTVIPGVGQVEVLQQNPDGSIKFRAPNGRTGTYKP